MYEIPQRRGHAIISLTPDEYDLVDWSEVKRGCCYIDLWGKITTELHNKGNLQSFHNTSWWKLFFRQHQIYREMPSCIIKGSRSREEHELLGGFQFCYNRKARLLIPLSVGLLSWRDLVQRGSLEQSKQLPIIRQYAFTTLFSALDDIAIRLNALILYANTAVLSPKRMESFGCVPCPPQGILTRIFNWILCFPYRGQKIYAKVYEYDDEGV